MKHPDDVDRAIDQMTRGEELTPEEVEALREVLDGWRTIKAWGRLGRIALWVIISLGAAAAAVREMKASEWFGG